MIYAAIIIEIHFPFFIRLLSERRSHKETYGAVSHRFWRALNMCTGEQLKIIDTYIYFIYVYASSHLRYETIRRIFSKTNEINEKIFSRKVFRAIPCASHNSVHKNRRETLPYVSSQENRFLCARIPRKRQKEKKRFAWKIIASIVDAETRQCVNRESRSRNLV